MRYEEKVRQQAVEIDRLRAINAELLEAANRVVGAADRIDSTSKLRREAIIHLRTAITKATNPVKIDDSPYPHGVPSQYEDD